MSISRRSTLVGLSLSSIPWAAMADGGALAQAIREQVGDAVPRDGGIAIRLPALAENGGQVPLTIAVDSPMTDADHITAIHIFATSNPTPGIASFRLTPLAGRAEVQTRIRLAKDQQIVVIATTSNGDVFRAVAEGRVTQSGCLS